MSAGTSTHQVAGVDGRRQGMADGIGQLRGIHRVILGRRMPRVPIQRHARASMHPASIHTEATDVAPYTPAAVPDGLRQSHFADSTPRTNEDSFPMMASGKNAKKSRTPHPW